MDESAPLAGIRVVDMATFIFGPASTTVMADWGAEVVKVESPGIGDPYRYTHLAPPFPASEVDYMWQLDNRGKRGVVVDATQPDGRDVLLALVRRADVFVTNFPPRVLAKLRIRYEDLAPENERLIYAQVTGYGERGEEIDKPGYDASAYWARSGLMDVVRPRDAEPALPAAGMGDHPSAMSLFGGIMLALYRREHSGRGTKVSSSLAANGAWANGCQVAAMLAGAQPSPGIHRREPPNAGINQYPTRDGRWILLLVLQEDKDWPRFLRAIEREELAEDSRFAEKAARHRHAAALATILDEVFVARDCAEWQQRLDAHQITFGVVQRTEELPSDPQLLANDVFVPIDGLETARMRVVDTPLWLADAPKPRVRRRAPKLGEHTDEVLAELGYDATSVQALRSAGAVG